MVYPLPIFSNLVYMTLVVSLGSKVYDHVYW